MADATSQTRSGAIRSPRYVINGLDRPLTGFSKPKAALTDGVKDWRLHDLRRSFASGLQRLKVRSDVIERCLNHALPGIKKIYQRDPPTDEKAEAWEAWSRHVLALVAREKMKAAA